MKLDRGYSPLLHRFDVDAFEEREHKLRRIVLDVLDEHPPAVAADVLRRSLGDEERAYFRRCVEAIGEPPPLPTERVPATGSDAQRDAGASSWESRSGPDIAIGMDARSSIDRVPFM